MYSIAFPDIFNGSKVNLNKDYDAIKINLKSLLMSNTKIFLALVITLAISLKFPLLTMIALPVLCLLIIVGLFKSIGFIFSTLSKLFK